MATTAPPDGTLPIPSVSIKETAAAGIPAARDDIPTDIGSWCNQLWVVMAPVAEKYIPGTVDSLVSAFAGPLAPLVHLFLPSVINDAIHAIGPGLAVLDANWKINVPHNILTDAIMTWMNKNAKGMIALAGAKVDPIVAEMVTALKLPPPPAPVEHPVGTAGSKPPGIR